MKAEIKFEQTVEQLGDQQRLRVLFVASGNRKNHEVVPFIKVQGDSLAEHGVEVVYYKVIGKGIFGYLRNVLKLRRLLVEQKFDLIHAHFTLSAWVAVLAGQKIPIVLSLMGTDAYGKILGGKRRFFHYYTLLTYLIQPFVKKIISKSPNIERVVWQKEKSFLLPNGVNLEKFYPMEQCFREKLGLKKEGKYVLFLGNREDPRKNFQLLESIIPRLAIHGIQVLNPYPIPHTEVVEYLNSVDLLVMCSYEEGSPNVVKEAMACNCKGVFTDVGDVRYLINNTAGYQMCEFNERSLVLAILTVLSMEKCEGRKKILELDLELHKVAGKLKCIYLEAIQARGMVPIASQV
jgi:teichuronic acid biosynthesis glycosyltransferase TuaC